MQATIRAKLLLLVGTAAFAFLVMIVLGVVVGARADAQLATIRDSYVPRVELAGQVEARFESLRRGLQDAVAARDFDALEATRDIKRALSERMLAEEALVGDVRASNFLTALDSYYSLAYDVSRRMIDGETGEELVDAMAEMQARQMEATQRLQHATAFDRSELTQVFAAATAVRRTGNRLMLLVAGGCLVFLTVLGFALSRDVLLSLGELKAGLDRFAQGQFDQPIPVRVHDEIGEVARQANLMAASLQRLNDERDEADWLKGGLAGLAREVRGELTLPELGARAVSFLARYAEAPMAALYQVQSDGVLRAIGHYAGASFEGPAPTFKVGEGLLGRAALGEEIVHVNDVPSGYARVRSGLGEAPPRALVLVPLLQHGVVSGVLELGLFAPCSPRLEQLLLSVRETLAIAMEVARARAATEELLFQTQAQAEQLGRQEEKLQATNEELSTQQEELRQINEALTQQTAELEAQRQILEEKNAALDEAGRSLAQKADELARVSAYKSQFLANMSHELRTPLNSMLLLSNLLAENNERNLSEKQVEYARTIHGAGKDLLGLINQILDLARIEAGKQMLRIEPYSLARLTAYAERTFGPLARDKGLELATHIADDLPPTLLTDSQRLQQIVNNLLGNAIKFTAQGKVELTLRRPRPDEDFGLPELAKERTIALSVSDTGEGIAPEHRARIFSPFEQVEGASDRRFGGSGLGLAIARELAHLLGGEIQLTSVVGQGSTFTCYLPEQPPRLPLQREASPPSTSREREPGASRDGHLLVIEDDPAFARTLCDIIEQQGLSCELARDGETGLALARVRPPSGIILDVTLPGADGWQIMQALREEPRTMNVPVHFVSGVRGAERALAMGALGYLPKPASREDIVKMVDTLAPGRPEQERRVLVVERDQERAHSLVPELEREHLGVLAVEDVADALAALERERFACVILELSASDRDGRALLGALEQRSDADAPPVVVYTERPSSRADVKNLEASAEAVVLKEGASTERLLDEVRSFVRRLKSRRSSLSGHGEPSPAPHVRLDGKKVLVVDDDMRTVYALSATLQSKGAEVLVADTGQVALDMLAQPGGVDLVLMDIMMPEMDGYETMRRIRRDLRLTELPIIALTAKVMKGDREKSIEAGANDYLPKPIDPERLLSLLAEHLRGRERARAPAGRSRPEDVSDAVRG